MTGMEKEKRHSIQDDNKAFLQGNDMGNGGRIFMQIYTTYSLQELLRQYMDWGFNLESISIATQIPEEDLRQLCSDENYRLQDKDKEAYLVYS